MGENTKRRPRKKMSKSIDKLKPLTIEVLGTNDDPCFGKHFSPKAEECRKCGDSEICSIAMGQINHMLRAEQGKKMSFKDEEESSITKKVGKKELRKSIKNRIREMAKMGGEEGVKVTAVIEDIYASFSKDNIKKPWIKKYITIRASKSKKLVLNKNILLWKSQD